MFNSKKCQSKKWNSILQKKKKIGFEQKHSKTKRLTIRVEVRSFIKKTNEITSKKQSICNKYHHLSNSSATPRALLVSSARCGSDHEMTESDHRDERQRKDTLTALMGLQTSFPRTVVLCVAATLTRYIWQSHHVFPLCLDLKCYLVRFRGTTGTNFVPRGNKENKRQNAPSYSHHCTD